ncbi:MAG: alpha/beta hydrolase [Sphingomonadaceae bacterium]|nr:alpha/beta hydrolase [Sphingomonadaceae bacterium]
MRETSVVSSTDKPQSTHHLVAPELKAALEDYPSLDFELGVNVIRDGFSERETPPLPEGLEQVSLVERTIPGHGGAPDIRLLIYTPPGDAKGKRPAICHIHGGGYVIGTPEINDISNRSTALSLGCVIVSVDYRKAPETQWPDSRDDCYAGLCWMRDNADTLGIDPDRIAVSGESAGGGHAAALAIHARKMGGPKICLQALDAPMLDDRTGSTSDPHPYVGEFVWTPASNHFGWKSLLGVEPGGPEVTEEMAPARTQDLSGLPPVFITVGALDLFLEEDLDYIRRLARAGVSAEIYVIPGAYHGFGAAGATPQMMTATQLRNAALARAFGTELAG